MNLIDRYPRISGALGLALIVAMLAAMLSVSVPQRATANQSEFCGPKRTAGATTSPSYITAGNATTTLTVQDCSDGSTAIDSAFGVIQVISSTTPPSLVASFEVSRDGLDWYPYPVEQTGSPIATSTTLITTGVNDYRWLNMASTSPMAGNGVASTTAGTASNVSGARFHLGFKIPATPYPYLRVNFSVPAGAPAIGLYAELMLKREKLAR